MKKFFSILAAVLFSGSMMAAEVVYVQTIFNAENNSGKVSVYTNTWTNTTDGFTVNIVNANNNNNNWKYIKMGSKNYYKNVVFCLFIMQKYTISGDFKKFRKTS